MFTWLADNLSAYLPAYVVAIIIIAVAIIFGLFWFAKAIIGSWEFYRKTKTTNEGFNKLTESIEDGFDKFKKEVRKDLKKMGATLSDIETQIRDLITPENERLTATNSPITLTEVGQKLIEDSGSQNIVDNEVNRNKILSLILEDPTPNNAYDAQQKTIAALRELKDDPIFSSVKDFAFRNGKSIEDILYATAIHFRRYVLERLGYPVEDLDHGR